MCKGKGECRAGLGLGQGVMHPTLQYRGPCPPAMLEPKATEGSTSPLLMQQLFQPQENPCPYHSPLQQSSVQARPADPLEQLQSDPDSHQQHIPQL